jgi:hypothetical protein
MVCRQLTVGLLEVEEKRRVITNGGIRTNLAAKSE